MSRTRNMSDLLDSSGDVKSGALDNVPASDLVSDTTPQLGGALHTNGNDVNFADNNKAVFGAGSDLQIYHNGAGSFIDDAGTGNMFVRGNNLLLQKYTGESYLFAEADGAVTIYHDNSPKLATTSTGVYVTGRITTDGITEDTSGNVGIGGSPSQRLHVHGGAVQFTNTQNTYLQINTADTHLYTSAAHPLRFGTNSTERMRIDSSGNVGIGKSSSITDKLHIENTGANCLLSVARTDGAAGRLVMQHTSSAGALQTTGSVPLTFGTADTERMRINSSGNVGIGVVPETFNTVEGAVQVGTRQTLTSFSNDVGIGYNHYYNSGWKYTNADVARRFSSTSTAPFIWQYAASGSADAAITWSEAMRIDSSGNVGIGEDSPAAPLHVSTAASTTAEIRLTSNNTGSGSGDRGRIAVYSSRNDGTAYQAGLIDIDRSSGTEDKAHILFATNNGSGVAERLRIDSSGKVGIGTSSPSYLTELSGNGSGDTVTLALTNSGPHPARVRLNSSHGNWSVGNSITAADALEFRDESAGSTRMSIDASGRVTTPNQPRFRARNSGITNYTISGAISFNTEDFDVGNNYSGSTFTCPVAGLYFFSFNVFANTGHSASVDMLHNGGTIGRAERVDATGGYESIGFSVIVECSANDTVRLHLNSGQVHTNGALNLFIGYLIG